MIASEAGIQVPPLNFMLIGAAKSGTTSIYQYLAEHPQVYLPAHKEPKFLQYWGLPTPTANEFDRRVYLEAVREPSAYCALFKEAREDQKAVGEASATYLYVEHVASRIRRYYPNIKLIAVLRHPAERAYSHFLHNKDMGVEPLEFSEALDAENDRMAQGWQDSWHYRTEGLYASQVKRYLALFEREQVRVYLYEDLRQRPADLMREIYAFLGVRDDYTPELEKQHNVRTVPRSALLERLLHGSNSLKSLARTLVPGSARGRLWKWLDQRNQVRPGPLDPDLRRGLVDFYREDIRNLQDLIKRDLSPWLKDPASKARVS